MGVYYGMNGLWVPVGGQGGAAPIDPNLLAENIKSGVTISGVTGTFTNDGTAMASDMASGKTAYINGKKVTGNIPTYTSSGGNWPSNTFNSLFTEWSGNWENQTSDTITVIANANYDVLLRKDAGLHVKVPKSEFGNAATSDVASGKTFTSSAGLKRTGTGILCNAAFYEGETTLSSYSTSLTVPLTQLDLNGTEAGSLYTGTGSTLLYAVAYMINGTISSSNTYVCRWYTMLRWDGGTVNKGGRTDLGYNIDTSYNNSTKTLTLTGSSSTRFNSGTWRVEAIFV